ncbi:MAG: hypothetical protein H0T47_24470 [Planctomycetaceae bacterium]|nr:hypothetical protein [Planctomycetaceae bacterium]
MTHLRPLHNEHSSYREKLVEHLFIGEVLRYLWCQGVTCVESLKPEVDNGGYDLVIACGRIIRHVQLKSSFVGSTTARQKIHLRLAEKSSGCVVWIEFDPQTLAFQSFLWFGDQPGRPLPDISTRPVAKHAKANMQRIKAVRPNLRVLPRSAFEKVHGIAALIDRLFGTLTSDVGQAPP